MKKEELSQIKLQHYKCIDFLLRLIPVSILTEFSWQFIGKKISDK